MNTNSTKSVFIKNSEKEEWVLSYSKEEIVFADNIQYAMDFSKVWFKKLLLKSLEKQFGMKLEFKNFVFLNWNINEMIPTNFARGE